MWTAPPAAFNLETGDLHLFLAHLRISPHLESGIMAFLAPDEVQRSKSFRFLKDRSAYIASRGYLRILLSQYLALKPKDIELSYTDYGKPFIPVSQRLQFNVSHAGSYAVLGFSNDGPVGVDIEPIDRKVNMEQVAQHSFSPAEQQSLFSLPPEQQREAFFTCWTRKEAFIKAKGEGLSIPLQEFEVSVKPQEKAALKAADWDQEEPTRWTFNDIPKFEGYIGAWACGADVQKIHTFKIAESFLVKNK